MAEYQASDLTVNIDFTAHVDGDKTKELVKYQATVLFSSLEKLLEAGGESVTRKLQTRARNGKFPVGRRVVVDEDGKFTITPEERIAQMNEAEAQAEYELLKARFEANKAKKI
jgi:hypothetical protein